jgi:hypothetical protein
VSGPGRAEYDVTLVPTGRPTRWRSPSPFGCGYRHDPSRPEILLPSGVELELVLREPLLLPEARVRVR